MQTMKAKEKMNFPDMVKTYRTPAICEIIICYQKSLAKDENNSCFEKAFHYFKNEKEGI